MLGENKKLKDTPKDSIKDTSPVFTRKDIVHSNEPTPMVSPWRDSYKSYTKTDKLITALYMVTDTMEKEEPMRLKLRTLGIEILSDIASLPEDTSGGLKNKIMSILSFLNIAHDMQMISEMNHNILKKEFVELKQSIQDFKAHNHLWLEEFMLRPSEVLPEKEHHLPEINSSIGHPKSDKGQVMSIQTGTRIGVQKGSTLLKALSNIGGSKFSNEKEGRNTFEDLKNKRREEIIDIIKDNKNVTGAEGSTITDIRNGAKGLLASCGEKTLQRELVSMVSDRILYRTGSKRWSHYFIVS